MRKITIAFSLFLSIMVGISTQVQATHYMGGEITWECIPTGQANAGKYIFTMKIYRECYTSGGSPAAQFPSTATLSSNSPAGSISMSEISGWPKDISPVCNSNPNFPHLQCTGMSNGAGNMGACRAYLSFGSRTIEWSATSLGLDVLLG
jgi:hypothetical protein